MITKKRESILNQTPEEVVRDLTVEMRKIAAESYKANLVSESTISRLVTQNLSSHRPQFVGNRDDKMIAFYYPHWISFRQGKALGAEMVFNLVAQHVNVIHLLSVDLGIYLNPLDYAVRPVITTFLVPLSICHYNFDQIDSVITVKNSDFKDSLFQVNKGLWSSLEEVALLMKCKDEPSYKVLGGFFRSNLLCARIID